MTAIKNLSLENLAVLVLIAFLSLLGMWKVAEIINDRLEEENEARAAHAIKVTNDVQNYINNH